MIETDKWEDTKNSFPYEDILYLEHPTSKRHPRQSLSSRAGQFSPFAALTGYEEQVKEVARYTSEKIILEEAEKEQLDEIMKKIEQDKTKPIKITYFQKDFNKKGGKYKEITGYYSKMDTYHGKLILQDKSKITIQDIVKIEIINIQE